MLNRLKNVKLTVFLVIFETLVSMSCLTQSVQAAQVGQSAVSLSQAAALIISGSQGAIRAATGSTPVNPQGEAVLSPWHFEIDNQSVLTPSQPLQAEYIDQLFTLDPERYISLQGTSDFLNAKENYYRKLIYSFSQKQFLQNQTTLSDWSGLNHPPVQTVDEKDLKWIDQSAQAAHRETKRSSSEFHNKMDSISDSELTAGNTFAPFTDQAVVPALLEVIQRTKNTLWGSALLFACDKSTQSIVSALEDRADHGVDVRIMVDRTLQTMQSGNCQNELRKHGVQVILVPGMLTHGSAFHVKLWMSDFEEGLFLGANLMDIQTQATGFNHLFHDSGMVVHGPVVTDMAQRFHALWSTYSHVSTETDREDDEKIDHLQTSEREHGLRGATNYDRWFGAEKTQGLCRVVTQERHSERDRVSKTLGEYLKTAKSRIWFTSVRRDFHETAKHPEIGYNELLLSVLDKAKNEGVHVEMIYNAATNPYSLYSVPDTGLASPKKTLLFRVMKLHLDLSTDSALKDGAEFFEQAHQDAPLFRAWSYFDYSHMKNLLIDDDFVLTGSYNPMDERSTNDAEIAVFCQDRELNQKYSLMLARDLVNSIPYPYASQIH